MPVVAVLTERLRFVRETYGIAVHPRDSLTVLDEEDPTPLRRSHSLYPPAVDYVAREAANTLCRWRCKEWLTPVWHEDLLAAATPMKGRV